MDFSKSDIVKLRTQELANQTTAIRDIAQGAVGEPGADTRGVTAARITALNAAITTYTAVMNTPRGQIVNRGALLKEVETDTAALLALVNDMDDLVAQFDGTEDGLRFIDAWRRARIIVDVGGGQAPPPPPAPTP